MRMPRWFLVGVCLLILGVAPWRALAQQSAPQPAPPVSVETQQEVMEELQLTRTMIQVERQAIITQAMDLTPEEMEGFWPLYREYRLEAVKIGDRIVSLIQRYAANYDDLTDQTANKLVTDFVKVEQARARLKATYLPKFKKVLPAKKVARFYQVENKLDTLILAEMAEQIPLVR
jgi:hypothetical protein